jgi:hypothetical protein
MRVLPGELLMVADSANRFWENVTNFNSFFSVRHVCGASRMGSKARKGQVFIILLIILVVVIVLFVALPMFEAQHKSTPLVQQVFWNVNDRNVTSCYLGEDVEAHIVIKGIEEYSGSIVVKIRKDATFWFDSDYTVKTFPVDLPGGQTAELVTTFAPDEGSGGQLRGYFVEVDFLTTHSDWIMESSYPPRLKVIAITPGGDTPS